MPHAQSVCYAQFSVIFNISRQKRASLFHCNSELSRECPEGLAKLPKVQTHFAAQSDANTQSRLILAKITKKREINCI